MTCDFTLSRYKELCNALLSSGYNTITVQEYIQGQDAESFAMLRHDVDRIAEMWDGNDFTVGIYIQRQNMNY